MFDLTTEFDATPEEAFAFLTDLDFLPQWTPGLRRVTLEGGALGLTTGVRLRERRHVHLPGPVRVPVSASVEILEHVPPHRHVVQASAPGIVSEWAWEVADAGRRRTRVTLTCRSSTTRLLAAPLLVPIGVLMRRQERRRVAAMREGFARWRGLRGPALTVAP